MNILKIICNNLFKSDADKGRPRKTETIPDLPRKDPNDYTLSDSSTSWSTEGFCTSCKKGASFAEREGKFCSGCGEYQEYWLLTERVVRTIWNGSKWIYQYREESGDSYLSDIKL